MEINNITAYQNFRPNFNGAYILKGSWEDVWQAGWRIYEKLDDPDVRKDYPKVDSFPGFTEFGSLYLNEFYSNNQRYIERLIVTNNHVRNTNHWDEIYNTFTFDDKEKPENLDIILANELKIINQKKTTYEEAEKAFERGNEVPLSDLLLKLYDEARETLQKFIDCAVEPMEKIEPRDAKKVLEAIKNNKFNFITGVIG